MEYKDKKYTYLGGLVHGISTLATGMNKEPCGRIQLSEKEAGERKTNFDAFECGMTKQEACQEAGRCLRCDKYGYGSLKGGRAAIW